MQPPKHYVAPSCGGEFCFCGAGATHKIGEEIPDFDDMPLNEKARHNLTRYICCVCFTAVLSRTKEIALVNPRCLLDKVLYPDG